MEKWLILIIISVLVVPVASARFCEDILSPTDSCNMTTPVLACSTYNYTIIAENGSIIDEDNLILMNRSIYRYEISNLSEGSYIQLLCDGRTRELYVRDGDSMSFLIAIGLIIVVFIWLLMKLAESVGKEHELLKIGLYIFAVVMGVAGLGFSVVMTQNLTTNTAIVGSIGTVYKAGLWVIRILFGYIFVYYGYKVLKWLNATVRRRK